MNHNSTLTNGPIGKKLIDLTIPMMFGMVAIFMFNLVDTFYVGMLGADELAAMGFTFPVIYMIMSIIMGLGIGASAVISNHIGNNSGSKVKRLATHSLILALFTIIVLAAIGLLIMTQLFTVLGAENHILSLVEEYMWIWFLTIPFLVIPMTGNNVLRATGDTKTPSKIMITAALINAVLDPFLIFGIGPFPRLELQGAALATSISWLVILIIELIVLSRNQMIEMKIPVLNELISSAKEIFHIGIPTAMTNMLVPVSLGILTRMISSFGNDAIAAFGVVSRIESMAMLGIMALAAVMTPFVGQNFGAGKIDRIRGGISFSNRASIIWGAGVFLLFFVFGRYIALIFNDDPNVIAILTMLLAVMPFSYGFAGISYMASSTFNAIGKPLQSSLIIIIRLFVLMIPLAYIGSKVYGLTGLVIGVTVANILIGIIAYMRLKQIVCKLS